MASHLLAHYLRDARTFPGRDVAKWYFQQWVPLAKAAGLWDAEINRYYIDPNDSGGCAVRVTMVTDRGSEVLKGWVR